MKTLKNSISLRLSVYIICISLLIFGACFSFYFLLTKNENNKEIIKKSIIETKLIANIIEDFPELYSGNSETIKGLLTKIKSQLEYPNDTRLLIYGDSLYLLKTKEAKEIEAILGNDGKREISKRINSKKDYFKTTYKNTEYLVFHQPIDETNWTMVSVIPHRVMISNFHYVSRLTLYSGLFGAFLLFFLVLTIIKKQLSPLKGFVRSTEGIAKGDFDATLANVPFEDELSTLRDSFANMQISLKDYIEELKITTAHRERMDSELSIANEIQMAMLPKADSCPINIAGLLQPAKQIGGDLFDYLTRDGKLYFIIGDVAGKGISSALIMSTTISLFRSAIFSGSDKIMSHINNGLCYNNDLNIFVTAFVGVLDLNTCVLSYKNAGHNTFYLIKEQVRAINPKPNIPLGLIPDFEFEEETIQLENRELVFLYTDGVSEAENHLQEEFGEGRLKQSLIDASHEKGIGRIIDKIIQDINTFCGDYPQHDDITMLCFQNTKPIVVLKNDIQEILRLPSFTEKIGKALGLNDKSIMSLNIVLDELVSNIISHGYRPEEEGEIVIQASYIDKNVVFTITDTGKEFDPTQQEDIDISLPREEAGGLGIFMVKSLMDEIRYERIENKNIITLKKLI